MPGLSFRSIPRGQLLNPVARFVDHPRNAATRPDIQYLFAFRDQLGKFQRVDQVSCHKQLVGRVPCEVHRLIDLPQRLAVMFQRRVGFFRNLDLILFKCCVQVCQWNAVTSANNYSDQSDAV